MKRQILTIAVAGAVVASALWGGLALAQTAQMDEGRMLVEANCGQCHGVAEADASPHKDAPPFRNLTDRFPVDALEEAFSDGRIYSGHPDMPEFIATPEQIEAIIAYIAALQE